MSTTTATFGHELSAGIEKAPRKAGWFDWFVKARELQGRARVRDTFRMMSDMQLRDIGLTSDQVKHVREHHTFPAEFWRV